MKKAIFVFSLLLFLPLVASAFEAKTGNSVYVGKDQVVEGNLYAAGSSITIEGKITGDLVCAGQSITVNGSVDGDVICAGQSVIINGTVGGSLRSAGSAININGKVARNAYAFGANVSLADKGEVGWDMMIGAATTEIRGKIGRTLHGGVAAADISGQIAKYISLRIDNDQKSTEPTLKIDDGAVIGGDVNYTSKTEARISDKAVIKGKINYNILKSSAKNDGRNFAMAWVWSRLFSIFSSLAIGLVLISLWPAKIKDIIGKMMDKIGGSIGWGVIVSIIAPIIFIILMITLIGLPLAFMGLGLYLIALTIGKILVGITIGKNLLERFWQKKKDSLALAMIVGIVVCWLIFSIPLIGWLLCLVAIWWGLGTIWMMLKNSK